MSRMQGDRSHDEQQKLEKEIRDKTADLEKHKKELALLTNSNKQLLDEKRNITKVIARVEVEKQKIDNLVSELRLENEMIRGELETVVKKKEKTLVSFDVMKLEIKRIKETVNLEADKVYGLENRKYQLEMSMEEREKEIQVHKDILTSELKSAEEERHQVKVELQVRKNKVKNLRIKYEGLTARNKSSSGESDAGEHGQAYYVIKAAQEKEELQRFGDELDGKVKKCEKEIKALLNTLDHLKVRNKNYRDKFMQGAEGADLEKKQILEDQCRAASETLFRKRRDLQQLQSNFETASRELNEIRGEKNDIDANGNEINQRRQENDQEYQHNQQMVERATQQKDAKQNNARAVKGEGFDQSPENMMILAEIENQKNAFLCNALSHLINDPVINQEAPNLIAEIQTTLAENQIEIPEQPN